MLLNTLITLALVATIFTIVLRETLPRTTALMLGAGVTVAWGTLRGFYGAQQAMQAISVPTVLLLVTMTVIVNVMEAGGLFAWIAIRIARITGGSQYWLFWGLALFTLVFSYVADNLTVIVVVGTLTVGLLRRLSIRPAPYVAAELIASNIGGASTLVGDFPNLIIGEKAHIGFLDFLAPGGMFWINLLSFISVMLWLTYHFRDDLREPADSLGLVASSLAVITMSRAESTAVRNPMAVRSGLLAMLVALVLFATHSIHHLDPVVVALLASVLALTMARLERHDPLIDEVGLRNVMAFIGLFVLAGAVEATGVLDALLEPLLRLSDGHGLLTALMLMPVVAAITALVDAGPTTAAFIPLIARLEGQLAGPPHFIWWTLSFGVLAGSSATILGATAGHIAAGLVEAEAWRGGEAGGGRAGFVAAFSRAGVPAAGIMLGLSAIFLITLFLVNGYLTP